MKLLVLILALTSSVVAFNGCVVLPEEESLKAEVHYFANGKKIEVISAKINFERYREAFILGITQGYSDVAEGKLTIVEFRKGAEKNEYFHWVGTKLGMRIAKEAPNQPPDPTSGLRPAVAHLNVGQKHEAAVSH